MRIEKDKLEKLFQQAQESSELASNAADLMGHVLNDILLPEKWEDEMNEDDFEPLKLAPEVRAVFDLWGVTAWMAAYTYNFIEEITTLLNGGVVERQEDETIEAFQAEINKSREEFVNIRAAVNNEAAFIYKQPISEEV